MICSACVGPNALKAFVESNGRATLCTYCALPGLAVEDDALFSYIYERVTENTATESDLSDYEYNMIYEGESDEIEVAPIDVVLAEWMSLGDEPYFDQLLDRAPQDLKFSSDGQVAHFFMDDGTLEGNAYQRKWERFIHDAAHARRFFNKSAESFLDEVFAFLTSEDGSLKPECVRTLHRGAELYRARVVDRELAREINRDPARGIGPAPGSKASNQRMTPSGIPALYCALDRATCLSEIRAITGDIVITVGVAPIASFDVLDLTRLHDVDGPVLTLLDRGHKDSCHLKSFIGSLVGRMSKPKGRGDELTYLSTQIVFEYLRIKFGREVKGLAFPSVQTGGAGVNVVLFPDCSKVWPFTEVAVGAEETGPTRDYAVGVVPNSIVLHRIDAIRTISTDYTNIYTPFMSELTRRRLGLE